MRSKTTRAFRTISEAGEELGLQPHVLRFWESKFADIKPIKRGGGRRFYRPEDIEFIRGIKTLLYDEKHPIKDVQKLIAKSGAARIVELGRSVETASRERDIKETTLVPERLVTPEATDIAAKTTAPPPTTEARPEDKTAEEAASIEIAEDEGETIGDAIDEPAETPKDLSSLETALERLRGLRQRWDDFDKDEG